MKKVIFLLGLSMLFLSLVNGEMNKANQQKMIWKKHQIDNYILVQQMEEQVQSTFVTAGEAEAMTVDNLIPLKECKLLSFNYRTVDDLFNLVGKLESKYGENLKVKYNKDLGYPEKIGVIKNEEVKCLLEIKDLIVMMCD